MNSSCFFFLWVMSITCATADARMAPRPSTGPTMTSAATFSSTMLRFFLLSPKIQPRSSPLRWLTVLLSRPQRSGCLRWRCPCAHIILTLASCGPHPLPAPRWLLGRKMWSSPSSQHQPRPSSDFPTIVLVTSWSSLGWHTTSPSSSQSTALHLRHALECAQWSQLQSWYVP